MPNNAFGYFLVSATQGLVVMPGNSQGNLCLGGSIGRYTSPGQVQNSGTTGGISLAISLTQIPTPTGFVTGASRARPGTSRRGSATPSAAWRRRTSPTRCPSPSSDSDRWSVDAAAHA